MEARARFLFAPTWIRVFASLSLSVTASLIWIYNADYLTRFEFAAVEVVLATLALAALFGYAFSTLFGSVRLKRFEGAKAEARRAVERQNVLIERQNQEILHYRSKPLTDYTLCSTCGWIGLFESKAPTYAGTKALGTVAAIGGSGIAIAGCGGSALGIILIIIGLPLLFLAGIGIIPIVLGSILLSMGGTATTVGATVATSGASTVSSASRDAQSIARAPHQCPQCKNTGLIPALSPVAINQIENNPYLASAAMAEAQKIVEALPQLLDALPLPTLACGPHEEEPVSAKVRAAGLLKIRSFLTASFAAWTLLASVLFAVKIQKVNRLAAMNHTSLPPVPTLTTEALQSRQQVDAENAKADAARLQKHKVLSPNPAHGTSTKSRGPNGETKPEKKQDPFGIQD